MYACMCACMYVCMHVYIYDCMHACILSCICLTTPSVKSKHRLLGVMYVCVHVCIYACLYIYIYIIHGYSKCFKYVHALSNLNI